MMDLIMLRPYEVPSRLVFLEKEPGLLFWLAECVDVGSNRPIENQPYNVEVCLGHMRHCSSTGNMEP